MIRKLISPFAILLIATLAFRGVCLEAPAPNATDEPPIATATADQLFERIQAKNADDVWEAVSRLARLARGDGSIGARLETLLGDSKDERVRLACAGALCRLGKTEKAGVALAELVQHGQSSETRRTAANVIAVSVSLHENDAVIAALASALKSEPDEMTRIVLARSHLQATKGAEGRDVLKAMLANSADAGVRDEAALALGENGWLVDPDVNARVTGLYEEPTERGTRARNLLKPADSAFKPPAGDAGFAKGMMLMRELTNEIVAAYPDETKIDYDKLFANAARGMVRGLDPFSQYLEPAEVKNLQDSLRQDYAGIGAFVGVRDNLFIITSPIFKSPAYEAGLRALDVLQEVDGVKVSTLLDTGGLPAVIDKLKGKPGTPVKIKYRRRGFGKAIEVSIVRQDIKVESVFATMLPGDIAYIRLTRFGERSAEEMRAAMDEFVKKQKAKGLVFDLRDNGGGLLKAGVDIADLFLSGNKLIVYSEGRKEFSPRKDFFATGGPEDEALPMVVLVNQGTASASEIVSGALQDHKRAPLVGEKTFGKGSVQQILGVRATNNETRLRLTIAKYYLPSGRSIHEKGIDPDIAVKPRESNGWILETLTELRRRDVFEDFIRKSWDANKDLYTKLAQFDGRDCNAWPGFEAFYQGLKTTAPRDDIRAELRFIARHLAQEYRKSEFAADIEEDTVLRRGVYELVKKIGIDPNAIAEYKDMPAAFKEGDAKKDDE